MKELQVQASSIYVTYTKQIINSINNSLSAEMTKKKKNDSESGYALQNVYFEF